MMLYIGEEPAPRTGSSCQHYLGREPDSGDSAAREQLSREMAVTYQIWYNTPFTGHMPNERNLAPGQIPFVRPNVRRLNAGREKFEHTTETQPHLVKQSMLLPDSKVVAETLK